jgi:predicted DNA binding CopG/RHH family protein
MTTRHIHSTLNSEQFKEVKKTIAELGMEMQEFIRFAVMEKCRRENERDRIDSGTSSTG